MPTDRIDDEAEHMSLFLILLGGTLKVTDRLRRQIEGARIIAADSGIRHAETLDVVPELWLGDFDSVPALVPERFLSVPKLEFPAEKDQTDGELAIAEALARGASRIILAGAFGGPRSDHAHLHLTAALRAVEQDIDVVLTSGSEEAVPVTPEPRRHDFAEGTLFSVLGFTELSGLTIEGAKWPLTNQQVPFGSSLTLSNEVNGALTIKLDSGRALLVAQIDTV